MTTKSKEKVNVKDGVYKATWSSFTITIIRPTVLDNNIGEKVIVNQVGCYGLNLGRIDFYFDENNSISSKAKSIVV